MLQTRGGRLMGALCQFFRIHIVEMVDVDTSFAVLNEPRSGNCELTVAPKEIRGGRNDHTGLSVRR